MEKPPSLLPDQALGGIGGKIRHFSRLIANEIEKGDNGAAGNIFKKAQNKLGHQEIKILKDIVDRNILFEREREITTHGIIRSFRFWSQEEKKSYLQLAMRACKTLEESAGVPSCVGFGSALAIARSDDLIPHDDDIDLISAFPKKRFPSIRDGLDAVEHIFSRDGWRVSGEFAVHRKIRHRELGKKDLDIFVGITEGDYFSCFPGPRGVILQAEVFPAQWKELFGVPVLTPRDPDAYLTKVYGESWRIPDPVFRHSWDKAPYADLLG